MRAIEWFFYAVFCLSITASTIHFFFLFLRHPADLDKFLGNDRRYNIKIWRMALGEPDTLFKFRTYAYFLAVFVGLSFCIYNGALGALSWLPRTWTNDDNEWIGYGLSVLAAILGAPAVMVQMEALARKFAEMEDRDRVRG
jgi:hypothetical protein